VSDATKTLLDGRRVAVGTKGRGWLARLLGVERKDGRHLVTAAAWVSEANLLRRLGAEVVEIVFLIELTALEGRAKLEGYPVRSLIRF